MDNHKTLLEPAKRVLLILLPFWDPLVPPLGIVSLKTFLEFHGNYEVRAYDANIEYAFRDIYDRYFGALELMIPANKRKLLYNMGHEVLRNHSMAAVQAENNYDDFFLDLIIEVVDKTFYTIISRANAETLNIIIKDFLSDLENYIHQKVEEFMPDVFGLSVYSGSLPASIFAFKQVKRDYPHIMTVMGGPIFSNELKPNSPNYFTIMTETPYIDKIIEGEGEILFLKLLNGELAVNKKFYSKKDIDGNSVDLNTTPVPDFSDLDLTSYLTVSSSTGRSCPFECSFCSETIFWGRYTKKNPAYTAKEMQRLHRVHKKQLIFMCDSILNPVLDDLTRELQQIDDPIYFDGYFRIDRKSQDFEKAMNWRKGGYYRARIGVESGSEEMLNLMHKNLTTAQIKETIINLATAGIKTTAMFLVGHPGETEEHFQETLDMIEEIQDYIYEADCNPFQFFYSGQVDSNLWEAQFIKMPLYSEKYDPLIFSRTWTLDVYPKREIAYERANRFVEFVEKLGIQNPYKLEDIRKADERWARLHKNAVPSMLELQEGKINKDERKNVKEYSMNATSFDLDLDDWNL
ncbi:radical SAM superfamily enzyme YgiQ (UPF0313 family) [Mucilaginibacter sp. SG538B]|uniref:B12-binding domain-containing radical SAM protein n=1 Tax=Mucilaginibacter sp. SG538B TaxID=2587021 RepID=UPI00159D5F52|nr:radical SAM protein [Mucilaginibacter sp. SG538B]NVM67816.1 radical SAM superfamily enzyme YgiQ (UPF0313 family) [Mucilaginibacter sp. SG538B]